jgi:hypothetical protein
VAGFCKYGDVPAGSSATELVTSKRLEGITYQKAIISG